MVGEHLQEMLWDGGRGIFWDKLDFRKYVLLHGRNKFHALLE